MTMIPPMSAGAAGDDFLDGLEVVLGDRVLEPLAELLEREPTKRPVFTSMTVKASA